MTPAMKFDRAGLTALRDREREFLKTAAPRIFCCSGTGCHATGSLPLIDALREEAARQGGEVQVIETGCNGFCALGPVVVMQPGGILYCKVRVEDAADVVASAGGEPVERLLYRDPSGTAVASMHEIPFFALQRPRTLRNKGRIDPENIGHAIAHDGYQGLAKALFDMDPAGIVEEMRASGLRGRGGAGFSTGLKWKFAAASPGDVKYVLCNADEGDPGAFMDRSILESDPHAVLEGMLIAAVAIGSRQGYIYCRSEYPLAIKRLTIAIGQARERGLLGETSWAAVFPLILKSTRARAPSSAARRRRSCAPSRESAACPSPGRRSRRSRACGASRPSSTTSRPWPMSAASSASAERTTLASAPRAARARRFLPCPAM